MAAKSPYESFPWREGVVPVEVDGEPRGLDRRQVLRSASIAGVGISALALPASSAAATGGGGEGDLLSARGDVDTTFTPGDPNGGVYRVLIDGNGRVLIGGAFSQVGGVTTSGVARIHANGVLDNTFTSGLAFNQAVLDIALDASGNILAAGSLSRAGRRVGLVRLFPNGAIDATLAVPDIDNSFTSANTNDGSFDSVEVAADGKIYVAGLTTTIGDETRGSLARLHPNGAVDTDFADPGISPWARVIALDGQNVVAGGDFTSIGGSSVSPRLARFLPDGSRDTTFVDPAVNGRVYAIAIDGVGGAFIGGLFTTVGGQARTRVARVHPNGAVDDAFVPPTITGGDYVAALSLQQDGKVVIGGRFTAVGGTTRNNIARLHANGALDATFDPNLSEGAGVFALTQDGSARLIAGGFFTNAGGTGQDYLTRID
jgi:uncharacterized delta-60 repeat protein